MAPMTDVTSSPGAGAVLPSIAVVIPCWNSELWVGHAIRSVLDQNYPHAQVIVIDDGSTDGSLKIIQSFGDAIVWRSGPNAGACAARNQGLTLCSSDYVMFLDADDYLEGPLLHGVAECIVRGHPDMVVSTCVLEKEGVRCPPVVWPENDIRTAQVDAVRDYAPQGAAYCYSKSFITSIGGWNEKALRHQDVELRIRALMHRPSYALNTRGSAIWCIRPGHNGISTDNRREAWESVLLWHEQHLAQFGVERGHWLSLGFARRFYGLAVECFRRGWPDMARASLKTARRLGLRGHLGSTKFRAAAYVFGVQGAVTLASLAANVSHQLSGWQSPPLAPEQIEADLL